MYKSRLAILNMVEDARAWHRYYKIDHPNTPWQILAEDIIENFKLEDSKNSVDELKVVKQTNKIIDYIKSFEKARARFITRTKQRDEDVYVDGFNSGLKKEIQENIVLLEPKTLKHAFKFAKQIETILESQERWARFAFKYSQSLSKFSETKDAMRNLLVQAMYLILN